MSEDFTYAINLMHGYNADISNTGINLRDSLFYEVLASFNKNPINIFQVGAIESLDAKFRIGSGWSDIIFGKYIQEHGGKLTIVDINLDHLAHSVLMSTSCKYNIDILCGDAVHHIGEGYDLYYLDGADIPLGNAQTLEQFKKIEHTKSLVMVDDIRTKAVNLVEYLNTKQIEFTTHDVGGGMMTIDMRENG